MIERGADITHACADGSGPLHTFFNDVVSRVVLCHGEYLEANTRNTIGRTPLHYLAWSSRSTARDARAYLSDVSGLTAQDDEGRTPLHFAARRGNIELVRYFLTLIPTYEINRAAYDGRTAFHYAVESRRVDVLNVLQKGGMDIFKRDRQGRSVLHQAALIDNVEAVKCVLAITGKQELDSEDTDGGNPFHLACRYSALSVMEYLQSEYGLRVGADADIFTSLSSWSSHRSCHSLMTIIFRRMDHIGAVISAAFAIYLACYGLA